MSSNCREGLNTLVPGRFSQTKILLFLNNMFWYIFKSFPLQKPSFFTIFIFIFLESEIINISAETNCFARLGDQELLHLEVS